MRTRVALGATGGVVGIYGAFLLLSRQDLSALFEVGIWLAVGVVLHDFVLAPLLIGAGALVPRLLPAAARPAVAAGSLVLGSVTLLAVPVLGGFGMEADNPTLFDRPYAAGGAALAALVLVAVGLETVARWRRGDARGGPAGGARARR